MKLNMNNGYYYPHSYTSHLELPMIMLMAEYGWLGYGLYYLLASLTGLNAGYQIPFVGVKSIAVQLRIEGVDLMRFIEKSIEVGLFESDGEYFWCPLIRDSINFRDEKKQALSEAGKRGAEAKHSQAKTTSSQATTPSDEAMTAPGKGKVKVSTGNGKEKNSIEKKGYKIIEVEQLKSVEGNGKVMVDEKSEQPVIPTKVDTDDLILSELTRKIIANTEFYQNLIGEFFYHEAYSEQEINKFIKLNLKGNLDYKKWDVVALVRMFVNKMNEFEIKKAVLPPSGEYLNSFIQRLNKDIKEELQSYPGTITDKKKNVAERVLFPEQKQTIKKWLDDNDLPF